MKTSIRLAMSVVMFSFATTIFAQQTLTSSYFMEGSLFRHEFNPAFETQQSYFSMPVLGQFGFGVNGNLGVGDLFFNRNGRTVTYLHPDVSVADALSGINDNNKLLFRLKTQILGVGFKGMGGFNTISLSANVNGGIHFPYDIFDITKNLQNKNYNVGETGFMAQAYAELALGHSHRINEHWSVGGKFKFLIGGARINAEMDNLSLNLQSTDRWTANAHASVEANVKGLKITDKQKEYENADKRAAEGKPTTYTTIDDFDLDSPGIGGFGFAVDLGTEFDFKDIAPGLKLSLALLDLGFINWSESHTIENNGQEFVFDGFNNVKVEGGNGTKLSEQTDDLADRLSDLYNLQNKGDLGSSSHGIGTTLNVGVEYALPVYDKVRFGLLSTTRFQGDYTWNEERLSVNYAPAKWFEFNVNGALGSFGPSFGWMMNIHPVGFNLFLGMNHVLGKVSKQFVPLRSNADFTMGINFPLSQPKKKSSSDSNATAYLY